jgi:capsular polysaccharide biosynthesis protein
MDLLSVAQSLWRHKLVTIPVIVLTALMGLYIVKVKPPVYEATASLLLTNPQSGATASQIAADPRLKTANPYNTFVSYGSLAIIGDTMIELVTAPTAQQALTKSGVDSRYQMELSNAFGNPPIINITGVGSSGQEAIRSATLLVDAAKADLHNVQVQLSIDSFYMITAVEIVKPTQAQRSSSGKPRSLIAVLAIGLILLFVAVSVTDAVDKRRKASSSTASTPIRRYTRDDALVSENRYRRTKVR